MTDDFKVECCYCGQSLLFSQAVQISACLTSDMEEVQALCAHLSCFDKTLHAKIPRLFDGLLNEERSNSTQP